MIKWNEAVFDRADKDLMVQLNREQDDEFCRKLRAARRAGTETCPVGVSTEPGAKRPILTLSTAWIKRNQCLSHGAYDGFPHTIVSDQSFIGSGAACVDTT